jgi:outer membrane biosynthesis protein TonB
MILAVALLIGCGGEAEKETPKPATTPPAETPIPAPEPTQPAVEPTPEPTPAATPAAAPTAKPAIEKGVTIVGEVIDLVSYATSGILGSTPAGKEIITASAQGGNPLGILEKSTGEVYIVTMRQANTSANAALLPFVGMPIAAKGDVYRKGGQRLLVMNTVGKSIN